MPISCQVRDCKALLVTSLTHVSGAIASVLTFYLYLYPGQLAYRLHSFPTAIVNGYDYLLQRTTILTLNNSFTIAPLELKKQVRQ